MNKYSIASFHARKAADCLALAERISDDFTMHSYRAFAIANLISAADALGGTIAFGTHAPPTKEVLA